MPDTDESDDTIDAVASDTNIYGVLSEDTPCVVVNTDNNRPDLPDLHGVSKSAIAEGEVSLSDIGQQWIVGREGDQIAGDFEVWTPQEYTEISLRPDLGGSTELFKLETNHTTVTVGHDSDHHYSTELFWIRTQTLSDGYADRVDEGQTNSIPEAHSVFDIDDPPVSSIPDEYIDCDGEWVRGADTRGYGDTTTFEIFVPVDQFEISTGPGNPQIQFTEDSITRKHEAEPGSRDLITERQSGLYVDQVQVVTEDAVPDVDDDFVGGTVYEADGEQ